MARPPRRDEEVRRADELLGPEPGVSSGPASERPTGVSTDPRAESVAAPMAGLPQSPASGIGILGGPEPDAEQ